MNLDLFWRQIDKTGDCWLWTGYRSNGYGKHARQYAHRLMWSVANQQPIPEGMEVLHSCDNRICVNPAHLRIGTQYDNMQDMVARKRAKGKNAKLTPEQRAEIRARYAAIKVPMDAGDEYGVTYWTIRRVAKDK